MYILHDCRTLLILTRVLFIVLDLIISLKLFLKQEQSCFCILYDPLKPFLQIQPRHGAAAHDSPLVCPDGVEPKSLRAVSIIGLATRPNINVSTHLAHFVLAHGAGNIALVLEH